MHFLFVNPELPQFDRTSGGLRLFTFIELLRDAGVRCSYLLSTPEEERRRIGEEDYRHYCSKLESIDVRLLTRPMGNELRASSYDVVVFEFFHVARHFLDHVRILQPQARVVVDSVDLTFLRWHAKADLSGLPEDRAHAQGIEAAELGTYRRSDLVLTLTDEEAGQLTHRTLGVPTFNLPNIHTLGCRGNSEHTQPTLLFIGSFTHEPNVDAVRWFHAEVWPLIKAQRPDARWVIIGANAPDDIAALNQNGIEFKGRVPETAPYLKEAWVSVAPLRFGAGMKGKVGEALAWGLPAATKQFGAQGYGVADRVTAVLGDTAEEFAQGVVWLLEDPLRRQQVGSGGQAIIKDRFSREAVSNGIPTLLAFTAALPASKRLSWLPVRKAWLSLREGWQRHMAWRL